VKRVVAGILLAAVLLPAAARAEPVPGSAAATDAVLGLAADGTPRVAFASGGRLLVGARGPDGEWTAERAAALPGPELIVDRAAGAFVLVQDANGGWLALEERAAAGWRAHLLVRSVPRGASLGLAGLTLDAHARPVVAYALRLADGKTFLRLVRPDARGRFVTRAVTKAGFPQSDTVPSASPVVLPGGGIRVVATGARSAIEWAPKGRTWEGQVLYANSLGTPAGPVGAAGPYSAWTELFPQFGQSQVLLTLHADGERTAVLHRHAFVVALALGPTGPEVAANDYVELGDVAYAGLVVDAAGITLELGGKLVGYAIEPGGARQFLLRAAGGLEWYRTSSLPPVRVELQATSAMLTGSVRGASGGSVELYRGDELLETVPLGTDGSFSAAASDTGAVLYRAVYRDVLSGLPLGALVRFDG